jgi:hypothetical protein
MSITGTKDTHPITAPIIPRPGATAEHLTATKDTHPLPAPIVPRKD